MSTAPSMQDIRATLEQARAMDGREDTEAFALAAPGLIARLVQILNLYVGHEPTLTEEAAYARGEIERRDAAITEALRLLESAPEAFLGGSQNIIAAAHALRQASEGAPAKPADVVQYGIRHSNGEVQPVGGDREFAAGTRARMHATTDPGATLVQRAINAGPWTTVPAGGSR